MTEPTPDSGIPDPGPAEEEGNPAAVDTGDTANVAPDEQTDTDDGATLNDDAGDTLDDVEEGEVTEDVGDDGTGD